MTLIRPRSLLLAVPIVLVGGALTSTSYAAEVKPTPPAPTTTPSGLTSTDMTLMKNQMVLNDVVTRVLGDIPADGEVNVSGFGGVTMDPATKTVQFYWKGTVPSNVNTVRSSLPAGVTMTVSTAAFSRAELKVAQSKLLSSSGQEAATLTASGAKVSRIGPRADGSGLDLAYADTPTGAMTVSSADGSSSASSAAIVTRSVRTTSVDTAADRTAGVPVTTTYEKLAVSTSGRQNDTSPWFGGGAMKSPTGTYCTSGFAVKRRSDSRYGLLTADHCAQYASTGSYKDPGGEFIGSIVQHSSARDAALVLTRTDASSSGRVWFGPPTETSDSRAVSGAGTNVVGGLVCTSGAATGIHCSSKIESVGGTVRTADGVLHTAIVKATRTTGSAAVGTGDSGGPVVAYDGSRVKAMGMIVSGAGTVSCSSTPAISATCYKTVYYVDAKQVMTDFNLILLTASA